MNSRSLDVFSHPIILEPVHASIDYGAHSPTGWWDLGPLARQAQRTGSMTKWTEKKKENPQIIGIMCSIGFKHTRLEG